MNIEIVDYNPNWPRIFEREKELFKSGMEIHHIGSTAVVGLSAKPIIDILAVVKDLSAIPTLNYESKGEYGIPFRRYFKKPGFNLHIYEEGYPEIERYLLFRDWMRDHPDDRKTYDELKRELARQFPEDIASYINGKEPFIRGIDAKDGFNGFRLVEARTRYEWQEVNRLRKEAFFSNREDPFCWTFTHPDHIHFVYYVRERIVGYIHLQRWPDHRMALRISVIDQPDRRSGYGKQFLTLVEKWIFQEGYQSIHIQSSPEAYPFYLSLGYQKAPFNDPDGYPTDPLDIEIVKKK